MQKFVSAGMKKLQSNQRLNCKHSPKGQMKEPIIGKLSVGIWLDNSERNVSLEANQLTSSGKRILVKA